MSDRRGLAWHVSSLAAFWGVVFASSAQIELAPAPERVANAQALAPWFKAAELGRADIVCFGDSNQSFGGHGWDDSVSAASSARFGLYATGLLAPGENNGNGSGVGFGYQGHSTSSNGQFRYSGAPAELELFLFPGLIPPFSYLYVPFEGQAGGLVNQGMFLLRNSAIGNHSTLRFHTVFGVFPGLHPGVFRPSVRRAEPPFEAILDGPLVLTRGVNYGVASASIDLPAAVRDYAIDFRLSPWGWNIVGPFLAYMMRVENLDRPSGVAVHTLYAFGGNSARDMVVALRAASIEQLTLYFSKVRELQAGDKHVLVRINTGLNDRGESGVSLGPAAVTPSWLAEGYADNLLALMTRIEEVWSLNGWPADELFFLLSPSHPVSNPDEPTLASYRRAATELALSRPRTASTNFDAITSYGEMLANGWYNLGGLDTPHLSQPGYTALARRELVAAEGSICWRDLNNDQRIDAEDVYSYYPWNGDLNGDSTVNAADLRCLLRAVRSDEQADIGAQPNE